MKRIRTILALGAFFVLPMTLSACGSGLPGDAVVDMAGNQISTQAYKHWMFVLDKSTTLQSPGAPVVVPTDPPDFKGCIPQVKAQAPAFAKGKTDAQIVAACKNLFTSLSGQVLSYLITGYWYQAEAAKLHVTVTDAEVQKAFQTAKQQAYPTAAAFNQFLVSSGQTLQDILYRVRLSVLQTKLAKRFIKPVTTAQIQAYYFAHSTEFGTPESRDIRLIRTNKLSQATAAKAALSSGQSWKAVASKYSVDLTTKKAGGLLTGVTRGREEKTLDNAAFSATKGKLLGPLHGQFGYYVVEVVKIHKATRQPLAKATPLIRSILTGQQQQTAKSTLDNQVRKDWLSKTKCRSAFAMSDCAGYKPPKATTSTTPGATATTASSTSS